ncbi:MAG TPA: NUDIX hydrolase [Steroidobacteraceae bacterium]|nr:NUDIX hydrolase [Steroidobacteraceae bacterium]
MSWKPDVTVAAIIEREQAFLFVEERIGGRRVLNQPAGHVEDQESILAAVVREVLEETAWQFTPEWLIGVYLWRHPHSGRSTLRFTFSGRVDAHDPARRLDAPIIATHWLTRAELSARSAEHRTPLVLRCLDDYLAGRRLPLAAIAQVAPS